MAKDLFSRQTASYSKYRPTYPQELFEFILGYVPVKDAVWDCGTGNGQAALVLANYFNSVTATDISEKQLAAAGQHSKVEYIMCAAEHTPFPDKTFDLITVAQAYHWFNFPLFEKEVRRVGKTGAVVAIWGYNFITTSDARIDGLVSNFYETTIGPYWDAERKYVEENYDTVPFPFSLVAANNFSIRGEWSKADLLGYLNSWSAVQNYISANHHNPVDSFAKELDTYWDNDAVRPVTFPVFLKIGRVE